MQSVLDRTHAAEATGGTGEGAGGREAGVLGAGLGPGGCEGSGRTDLTSSGRTVRFDGHRGQEGGAGEEENEASRHVQTRGDVMARRGEEMEDRGLGRLGRRQGQRGASRLLRRLLWRGGPQPPPPSPREAERNPKGPPNSSSSSGGSGGGQTLLPSRGRSITASSASASTDASGVSRAKAARIRLGRRWDSLCDWLDAQCGWSPGGRKLDAKRLQRRLSFLTDRYREGAEYWQFVIWLRQVRATPCTPLSLHLTSTSRRDHTSPISVSSSQQVS